MIAQPHIRSTEITKKQINLVKEIKYMGKQMNENINGSMTSQCEQVMMIWKMNYNQKIMKLVKAVTSWRA